MAISFPLPDRNKDHKIGSREFSKNPSTSNKNLTIAETIHLQKLKDKFSKDIDDVQLEIQRIVRNVFNEYERKVKR